jgi:hypothetical protein
VGWSPHEVAPADQDRAVTDLNVAASVSVATAGFAVAAAAGSRVFGRAQGWWRPSGPRPSGEGRGAGAAS